MKPLIFAALILLLALSLGPLAWVFYSSATDFSGRWTWENYAGAWRDAGLARALLNSGLVTGATVFFHLLLCSLFAYPLALFDFPGKSALRGAVLATFFIPWEMTFVPLFEVCVRLGLDGSRWGVILPSSVNALGILFLADAYRSLPRSLIESARVDGLSEFEIWRRVALPLIRPSLAGLAVLSFVSSWSLFMWPLIILREPDSFTLTVGLSYLSGVFSANLKYVAAGSIISALPAVLLFLALQRHFPPGLTKGAVKG